jgi:hypothetical protein
MNRTFGALLITLILGFLVTPLAATAQQTTQIPRIGVLGKGPSPTH